MRKREKKYRGRINRFMRYLKKIDPLWIMKRKWFEDLNNFELGDNFYYKVFFVDDSIPPTQDKSKFYFGIVIYVGIHIQKKFGNKSEHLESGFEIESDFDDDFQRKNHESLLGYLWWIAIYKQAHKYKVFDETEEIELQKKMKKFNRI